MTASTWVALRLPLLAMASLVLGGRAYAAAVSGQVLGAGAPIANSTVTVWAATAGDPKQLAQARSDADGRFSLDVPASAGRDSSLYLVAKGGQPSASRAGGDNPAIALTSPTRLFLRSCMFHVALSS